MSESDKLREDLETARIYIELYKDIADRFKPVSYTHLLLTLLPVWQRCQGVYTCLLYTSI